jgi:hypothetical protein
MGKTRGQIKADLQDNLADFNLNFFSDDDLNTSVQDAYTDISILTQCIQENVTLNWQSGLCYYAFTQAPFNVSDYLGTIAIFNNVTNLWLRDDLSLKDFDHIRRDWEMWNGTPQFWAPSDPVNIAITPMYTGGTGGSSLGTFILYYWGVAPTLASDASTFEIATDMQKLLTNYATADLLEQAQEFGKAEEFWTQYYADIEIYADRVKRSTKSDLLLRV